MSTEGSFPWNYVFWHLTSPALVLMRTEGRRSRSKNYRSGLNNRIYRFKWTCWCYVRNFEAMRTHFLLNPSHGKYLASDFQAIHSMFSLYGIWSEEEEPTVGQERINYILLCHLSPLDSFVLTKLIFCGLSRYVLLVWLLTTIHDSGTDILSYSHSADETELGE